MSRPALHKCVYVGHRRFLPINNRIRWFGSSRSCCPEGYYEGTDESRNSVTTLVEETRISTKTIITSSNVSRYGKVSNPSVATNIIVPYVRNRSFGCDNPIKKLTASMDELIYVHSLNSGQLVCGQGKRNNQFFHEENFPWIKTDFDKYLSYAHADLRCQISYKHVTNDEHEQYVSEAELRTKPYKGVHGSSKFKAILKWDNLMWESYHVFKNVIDYLIQCLKGERPSESVNLLCRAENTHQCLWAVQRTPPYWQLSKVDQLLVDAIVSAIIMPVGFKSTLVMNPFSQTGFLNSTALLQLLTIFLPFALTFTKLNREYRLFIFMMAHDVADLLSPSITDDEIDTVTNKIYELVSIKEGLFPDSEGCFVWHQLTDLGHHIRVLGPIPCWWGCWGEREIGSLKRLLYISFPNGT